MTDKECLELYQLAYKQANTVGQVGGPPSPGLPTSIFGRGRFKKPRNNGSAVPGPKTLPPTQQDMNARRQQMGQTISKRPPSIFQSARNWQPK